MKPTTLEPLTGLYLDSIGTRYRATAHPKLGWFIQKLTGTPGRPSDSYAKPDFPAAVNAGIFHFDPTQTP